MRFCSPFRCLTVLLPALLPGPAFGAEADAPRIGFNADVRPILSANCFACHGPDAAARKADLRLDVPDDHTRELLAPGRPEASELLARVNHLDPDERMPPPESHKSLSDGQRATLRAWIARGAEYEEHWAFVPPVKASVPADWQGNPVDFFIRERLAENALTPSPPADPAVLARRLSFDMAGLPPTPAQVAVLANDPSPENYARLVDALLASPHFGERMAVRWLDLVRYADTVGFHGDQPVSVWPYRDYVIAAFNANMPYDRFTREQLAGDLLPDATVAQRVASGYNRLNMTTEEGGSQAKEYLAKYATDRVRTTAMVWMGATLGCAECHDHKFDPFTTRDFYRFEAFFADIEEVGVYNNRGRPPELKLPGDADRARLAEIDAQSANARARLAAAVIGAVPWPIPALRDEIAEIGKARDAAVAAQPTTLVTVSVEPRPIRILPRGNWMDDSGELVAPGVSAFLGGPMPPADGRLTRLDLANWLVSRDNPLTARVFVNRIWDMLFGTGISKTLGDLGTQGEWPTHPRLLDWLAVDFMEHGWNVKRLVRQIVMSDTYRQSSMPRPDLRERDPGNRLLARQSRFRVEAEFVRDAALFVSGLLVDRQGGPSVNPYQPAGYYKNLNFPTREYQPSVGDDQYRRGLYTHWQRTFLHPMLMAFDTPSRDTCTADRERSNTPLQALVLLNDPTFVEAARAFAARVLAEGGTDFPARIDWAFRQAFSRAPTAAESSALAHLHANHRARFAADPDAATAYISIGNSNPAADLNPVDLAAWTSVCRVLCNKHELFTRY